MPLEMITKEIFKQHYQKAKRKSFIQSVEMSILLKKEDIMFLRNGKIKIIEEGQQKSTIILKRKL